MLVTERFIITNVTEAKRLTTSAIAEQPVWHGAESMDIECLSCHGRWVAVLTGVDGFDRREGATIVCCPKCGAAEPVPDVALQDEATR